MPSTSFREGRESIVQIAKETALQSSRELKCCERLSHLRIIALLTTTAQLQSVSSFQHFSTESRHRLTDGLIRTVACGSTWNLGEQGMAPESHNMRSAIGELIGLNRIMHIVSGR